MYSKFHCLFRGWDKRNNIKLQCSVGTETHSACSLLIQKEKNIKPNNTSKCSQQKNSSRG